MEPPKKKAMTTLKEIAASATKEEKKGWCRQRFREEWCNEAEFEGWLEPIPDDMFRAWCRVCQCTLTVGRSELLKHAQTQKHKRGMEDEKSNSSSILTILENSGGNEAIMSMVESGKAVEMDAAADGSRVFAITDRAQLGDIKISNYPLLAKANQPLKKLDESLMKAELRIATFAVEHNLSALAIEHLGDIITSLAERPDIVPKIKMTRDKCTAVVRNVLAKSVQQDLQDTLHDTCFSLVIDETLMRDGSRVVCLIARFFSNTKNRIRCELLEAHIAEESVAEDGAHINGVLIDVFERHRIPLNKIIGVAVDHAGVVGRNLELLKDNILGENCETTIFNCTHRSMTEVAIRAAEEALPSSLEKIAKYLGHYVAAEASKDSVDKSTLVRDEVGWVSTRWLVEPSCIHQLLQQLPILTELLEKDTVDGGSPVSEALHGILADPYTKAHLLFLNYVLAPLQNIDELFRSDEVVIHRLQHECQTQFRVLCQHFLTPSTFMVDNLTKIDPYNEQNLLPLKDVFVGFDCQVHLQTLDPEKNEFFLMQCRKFFQVVVSELQSRVPLNNPILDQLAFLDPDVALRPEGRTSMSVVPDLGQMLGTSFDQTKLLKQWSDLLQYFPSSDVDELKKMPLDVMWGVIADMRSGSDGDELMFDELGRLAKLTLSLPLTNSDVASVSDMVAKLNRQRTNAGWERTLDTILPIRHAMRLDSGSCLRLLITKQHRKFYCLGIAKKDEFDDTDLFFEEEN